MQQLLVTMMKYVFTVTPSIIVVKLSQTQTQAIDYINSPSDL